MFARRTSRRLVSAFGIAISLFGLPVRRLLSDRNGVEEHLTKWIPAVLIVAYVALLERRPWSSIGLRWDGVGPFCRRVIAGLVVLLGANVVLGPLYERRGWTGDLTSDMASFAAYSLPKRGIIAITAGVTEEVLFRGYALERLEEVTGSRLAGAGVTLAAFVLSHRDETWDWRSVLLIAQPAVLITLLYLRTRDLLAVITVHTLNDFVGLVLADRYAADDPGDGEQ